MVVRQLRRGTGPVMHQPPKKDFKCRQTGHWAALCPVKGPKGCVQIVSHKSESCSLGWGRHHQFAAIAGSSTGSSTALSCSSTWPNSKM